MAEMSQAELLKRLRSVQNMAELDALRLTCVRVGEASGSVEVAREIQKAFIKAKNRLNRIPWAERTW